MNPESTEMIRSIVIGLCIVGCSVGAAAAFNSPMAGLFVLCFLILWIIKK